MAVNPIDMLVKSQESPLILYVWQRPKLMKRNLLMTFNARLFTETTVN